MRTVNPKMAKSDVKAAQWKKSCVVGVLAQGNHDLDAAETDNVMHQHDAH